MLESGDARDLSKWIKGLVVIRGTYVEVREAISPGRWTAPFRTGDVGSDRVSAGNLRELNIGTVTEISTASPTPAPSP